MEMGTNLQQVLRSLCLNTEWKYAIFWKLKHRARMMLTWEDAYYDNPDDYDSPENNCCQKTLDLEQLGGGKFKRDHLGLALAKMSYQVYSLGEGVVGQVVVTGNHRWICADNQVTDSGPSCEFADGWQSQFSAGIRTIVVVAVVPLGVVQLGSLNKVIEDMGFLTHIRSLFLSTQDYTIGYVPSQVQSGLKNSSSPLDVSSKPLSSEVMLGYSHDMTKISKSETLDILMPFQCPEKNYSPPAVYQKMAVGVAKHEGLEFKSDGSSILLQLLSNMVNTEPQNLVEMKPVTERMLEGNTSGCKDTCLEAEKKFSSFLHNLVIDNNSFNDLIRPPEKVGVDSASFPSEFLDAVTEKFQTQPCYKDTSYALNFPAGCELHEALGPGFLKGNQYFDWAAQVNQDDKTVEMPDEISRGQLTSESRREHLLEAMVANVCHSNDDINSELSFSTSMQSAMASGKNPEASIHTVNTINSEGYSIDQSSIVREGKHHSLSSSGICGVVSPKGFSSVCPSSFSEQFERSSEPAKSSKKRARPGENSRPRPRDRQLIQDRIKELRELVPNGAKCSIDSLLESTIKHMLFLQGVTKYADKLDKFADSKTKLHHMETDIHGSSGYQQGSSLAMEVGGHLKICSILVENHSKNGQMLVEMLCEECSHFLEIAEAIRSLDLTILKGATEAHGEKTCICFVVEIEYLRDMETFDVSLRKVFLIISENSSCIFPFDILGSIPWNDPYNWSHLIHDVYKRTMGQNNRYLHRLDILWPLVQLLQSKSTMHS